MSTVTLASVNHHPELRNALSTALSVRSQFVLHPVCKDPPAQLRLLEQLYPDT